MNLLHIGCIREINYQKLHMQENPKYKILKSVKSEVLEREVNKLLGAGWVLHGHTIVTSSNGSVGSFIQAMATKDAMLTTKSISIP